MAKFLDFYRPESSMDQQQVYYYAGLIVLILFLQVIVGHYYLLTILQLGLRIRIAVSSLIYRKALRLNQAALAKTTIGQMVKNPDDLKPSNTGTGVLGQFAFQWRQ